MFIKFENLTVRNKDNTRSNLTDIEGLADSLKRHGQRQSITVYPVEGKEWKYTLDAGYRRVAAAKLLGWEGLEATVVAPPKNVVLTNLVENVAREDISPYDFARACAELKASGMSPALISKSLSGGDVARKGTSVKNINNLIGLISGLDKRILKAWSEGHPRATTENLLRIKTAEDQWHTWQILSGALREEPEGEGSEGDADADADEAREREVAIKKPRAKQIAAAIQFLEQVQDLDSKSRATAIATLQWVLGNTPTLLGYDVG